MGIRPRSGGALLLFALAAVCGACSDSAPRHVADPIADIPSHQQRTVTRSELRYDWPLTVGTGTLGCSSKAVFFRAAGVTYAVNDEARSRGVPAVDPIRQTKSGPPTNPLKGVMQEQRMKIFAASAACERGQSSAPCKQQLRQTHKLSDADLLQIEVEGRERSWPPLTPQRVDLEPLIEAGLKLCQG